MNPHDIHLLAIIAEHEPATYADISLASRIADYFLSPQLDALTSRGFVNLWKGEYKLAQGVREAVLPS